MTRFVPIIVAVLLAVAFARPDEPSAIRFEEVWRLGELDSADEGLMFAGPQELGVDGDGFLYVFDSNSVKVRVYTPDGEHIRDIGAEGRGPGEVAKPTSILVRQSGDVVIADALNLKFIEYSRDGELVREVAIPEMSNVWPSQILPVGDEFVALYAMPNATPNAMPTTSGGREMLHLYSDQFLEKIESFGAQREIWNPDEPGQHAIAGGRRSAFTEVWGESICVVSYLYDGSIGCYRRQAGEWERREVVGDEIRRTYQMMPKSTRFGDRCCLSISGPNGTAIIRVFTRSRGLARVGDDLLHFSVRPDGNRRRLYVERFAQNGQLTASGPVENYDPFVEDEPAVFTLLTSTDDGYVYFADAREGYPVIHKVRVHFD